MDCVDRYFFYRRLLKIRSSIILRLSFLLAYFLLLFKVKPTLYSEYIVFSNEPLVAGYGVLFLSKSWRDWPAIF